MLLGVSECAALDAQLAWRYFGLADPGCCRGASKTGATLPPWRQAPSMLSKWRPRRSSDDFRVATPFGSFGVTRGGAKSGAAVPHAAPAAPCYALTACSGAGHGLQTAAVQQQPARLPHRCACMWEL